jgi:tetratricopeptide (TPR) repeat protein
MAEGTGRPDIRAGVMLNLADLLREEARDNEAGSLLDEARHLTGLSGKVEDTILIETAELTRDTRRWSESIELWSKVAEVAERERSISLEAIAAGGLGETWYDAGNPARAEPLLRRSLQLLRDDPGRSPGQLSVALALIARLYVDEGKLALAAEAVDEAISKDETSLGPDHPQVAILLELRAGILSRRGDGASAREDLERARIVMSSHFGAESPATAGVLAALGDVEERANRPAAAVFEYGRAMDLLRSSGQDPATFGAGLLTRYAAALKATHHNDEARAILKVAGAQGFREK